MTETQQRFLRVIAERIGAERVVELHLFPGIRQGGMESGVAVVAARQRTEPAAVSDDRVIASGSVAIAVPHTTAAAEPRLALAGVRVGRGRPGVRPVL